MSQFTFKLFPNETYMDMTLVQYGSERCTPNYSYGPAIRNHYLFHYIISGNGTLQSTDSQGKTHFYQLSQGMGFLICPGQVNTYTADSRFPWEYAWLEFDGLKARDILLSTGLSFDSPIYRSNNKELAENMKNEMLAIIENTDKTSLFLIAHLYLFLDLMIRSSFNHAELAGGRLRDLYIREAITFIERNYKNPAITIEDIARFCNLNQSYLGKIFKDSMQQTLQQFLIYFRMNKAAELLRHTSAPVSEVAKLVGYPNQFNFSRAFKNTYGLSPQYWRKENRLITAEKKK